MSLRRAGFTLLEVCIAMLIAMLLVGIAVPSVTAALREQRLKHSFEALDSLAHRAKARAVEQGKAYAMSWTANGIALAAKGANGELSRGAQDEETVEERLANPQGGTYTLQRIAAFSAHPDAEWIFWPSGVCEPVKIGFQGEAGAWTASYDPLSCRGEFLEFQTR